MRSYRYYVIMLLLLNVPPDYGCEPPGDSLGIQDAASSAAEVMEHKVPFVEYNDVPFVKCSIDGNEAVLFLIDTGASTNLLDYEYAKVAGVVPTSEEYRSLQGHPMRDASFDELRIGTLRLEHVDARLMNLKPVLPADCPAKGILGYPTFRRLELSIDYPKRTVSLREGAYRKLTRSFDPVFTFVVVPVWVENQGPFNFILDTGSNMSLVESHVLQELTPPKKESVPVVRIKVEGPGEGFAWPRKAGRIDGVGSAREYVRRACGVRIDGTLGWRHLKDYRVVINYPTCTYQFEKSGYAAELKPVLLDVTPDLSKNVPFETKTIVFEFSVPMHPMVSYLTTFECDHRWQDDKHLKLIIDEELKPGKEYEVILGHGFRSKKNIPLDWSPFTFKAVSGQ